MGRQVRGQDLVLATVTDAEVDATIIRADGNNAFTANQAMGGFKLTGLGAPSVDSDAARKVDVDLAKRGLDAKDSVRVATAAALPTVTAAGSGIGKTLTATAVGILTVDGVATVLNDRILVKDQVAGADNGLYKVTTEGTASVAFVLTRTIDADESTTEVTAGLFAFVSEGTVNGNAGYTLTTNDPIVLDTTALSFTQVSGAGQITAGAGLTKTGDTIDAVSGNGAIVVNANDITFTADATGGANLAKAVNVSANGAAVKVDDSTIEGDATTGQLKVKAAGITPNQLNTSTAGDGIAGGGGTPYSVATKKDEFTATSNNQSFTLVNTASSITGSEDVFLRGLHQPTSLYTLTATTLSFTAGEQLTGDQIEIRALV